MDILIYSAFTAKNCYSETDIILRLGVGLVGLRTVPGGAASSAWWGYEQCLVELRTVPGGTANSANYREGSLELQKYYTNYKHKHYFHSENLNT